jgi:hypothetical protein
MITTQKLAMIFKEVSTVKSVDRLVVAYPTIPAGKAQSDEHASELGWSVRQLFRHRVSYYSRLE